MYAGSAKLGRGGGRGGGGPSGGGGARNHRASFPPPPPLAHNRPSTGRLSLGGGSGGPRKNNNNNNNNNQRSAAASASAAAVEENFSLMPGNNPLAFGMIIRLAPDLVDEIRKLESQGSTARIKFDSIGTNPNGNVIDVGGKEFRFTWSRESDDLCDIYEERRSGDEENGLLVESGCAWRKLNVQRVLDESITNQVKMRSVEAERKSKSRKAIVLDHGNPSMKSQLKWMAAVETNPWRNFKQKKEPPFKKRKPDSPQVAGPPKSSYKAGLTAAATSKGRPSASPLASTPDRSGTQSSLVGVGNTSLAHMGVEDANQVKSKEISASLEKDIPNRISIAVRETPEHKRNFGAKPTDLQSLLIGLLKDNPKGMSLKALEKAVGDAFPNSAKKIEPIIKKIATFQAPGRYLLKTGVDLDSLKKTSSESGSSPEDNRHSTPVPEDKGDRTLASESNFEEKASASEGQMQLNSKLGEESYTFVRPYIQQPSPDLFGEKKALKNSEGRQGSSSDSGSDSDSDSDSSDSGSDSGSHSRSKSPIGSRSGSSSDSDSDASSNSKEETDEDVDIIASDDQDKLQASNANLTQPPIDYGMHSLDEMNDKQDGDGSDAIDIEGHDSDAIDIEGNGSDVDKGKDLPDEEHESPMALDNGLPLSKEVDKPLEEANPFSFENVDLQERQNFIGNLFDDKEGMFKDNKNEPSDSSERTSKSKSRRNYDAKYYDNKADGPKRIKADSSVKRSKSRSRDTLSSERTHNLSPSRLTDDPYRGPPSHVVNRSDGDGYTDFGTLKGSNPATAGKSASDLQQPSRRSSEQGAWAKSNDAAGRPNRHGEGLIRGQKSSEKSSHMQGGYPDLRENASRDTQNEDISVKERKGPRNAKEGSAGGKNSAHCDSQYRKPNEMTGKFKQAGQVSGSQTGFSPMDNSKNAVEKFSVNGRGSMLQRELSDLELGELREPLPEETPAKKNFERKSSFKQFENRPTPSDSDLSKGKLCAKATLDNKRGSPLDPNIVPGHRVEESTISDRAAQSQPHHLSRDITENRSQLNKSSDTGKSRQNGGAKQGIGLEGFGESHKKASVSALQQHEPKRGQVSRSKESKSRTSNSQADYADQQKDPVLAEGINHSRKRKESCSDDDYSYSKYEKNEPELKGPIKDFVQYKEYMEEYKDKYDSYCSLNKILESYRTEFCELGKDLESAKGKDTKRYCEIMEKLKESYRQCGLRHKKLKKIFVVLHEELKNIKQRMKDFALLYMKD